MALTVFPKLPAAPMTRLPTGKGVLPISFGNKREQRLVLGDSSSRVWQITHGPLKLAELDTLHAFLEILNYQEISFLYEDLIRNTSLGIALGTSTPSQTVFNLPTTGEDGSLYPVDVASTVLYDDGAPVSIASIDIDARTITASSAPVTGSVMTCDLTPYQRRYVIEGDPRDEWLGGQGWAVSTVFREVEA